MEFLIFWHLPDRFKRIRFPKGVSPPNYHDLIPFEGNLDEEIEELNHSDNVEENDHAQSDENIEPESAGTVDHIFNF